MQEKQAEKTKEEIEKQKVAKDLGVDSDYIVSMIKIEDKDEGSKLLNDKADKNDTKYIIERWAYKSGNSLFSSPSSYDISTSVFESIVSSSSISIQFSTHCSLCPVLLSISIILSSTVFNLSNSSFLFDISSNLIWFSSYGVNKLNVLYDGKKNKKDYRCYGIMTKKDFFDKINNKEDNTEKHDRVINSNSGYVYNLFLLFGSIMFLCYLCVQGAIYLVK